MAARMAPGIELLERRAVIPADILHAQVAARAFKPLVEIAMADPFLLKHLEAMGAGQADQTGIKPQRAQPIDMAVIVDLLKQGSAVQGGPFLVACGARGDRGGTIPGIEG
jgi:hypothetical protein